MNIFSIFSLLLVTIPPCHISSTDLPYLFIYDASPQDEESSKEDDNETTTSFVLAGYFSIISVCQVNAAENSFFVKTKLLTSSSETHTIAAEPATVSLTVMGINSNSIVDSTPYLTIQLPGR
ncbi:hypothetical protein [Enterobacter kobei]|uniref:Uncharacterized protein n=1 Tax=Enterobacter kobei TaxID=208224 RepID=A0AA86IU49_9ENTR|nr:hypothetical protein [Enterobacter kobei]WNP35543.1 hypothetical protein RN333_04735 [Enterobacter kobei]BCU54407.1 hypothetical protein ENKO_10010 [Enterobacter kobei]SIR52011.1 hypothetical protein SAMN05444841_105143 [Enterobacter kobei]